MTEHFPSLPEATLAAANRLGQWLALDDFTVQTPAVDIVVLAGNAVIPTIDAALSALEARMVARVPPMLQIAQERLADRTAEPVPRRAGSGALAMLSGRQAGPALALSPPA